MKMTDKERKRLEAYRNLSAERRAEIREALERSWRDQPCADPHKLARWKMSEND